MTANVGVDVASGLGPGLRFRIDRAGSSSG